MGAVHARVGQLARMRERLAFRAGETKVAQDFGLEDVAHIEGVRPNGKGWEVSAM